MTRGLKTCQKKKKVTKNKIIVNTNVPFLILQVLTHFKSIYTAQIQEKLTRNNDKERYLLSYKEKKGVYLLF